MVNENIVWPSDPLEFYATGGIIIGFDEKSKTYVIGIVIGKFRELISIAIIAHFSDVDEAKKMCCEYLSAVRKKELINFESYESPLFKNSYSFEFDGNKYDLESVNRGVYTSFLASTVNNKAEASNDDEFRKMAPPERCHHCDNYYKYWNYCKKIGSVIDGITVCTVFEKAREVEK